MEQPNLNYIKSMSDGDKTFENKLISLIKQEYPEEKKVYQKNINSQNYKATAEIVHKLKHKISILGLVKGYDVATNFENNLKEDKILLKEEFEAILDQITKYLTKL
ncbi:Hpt domain-containing protein [Aurantibacter sp.]|uniref:Hpt domain-containing protein n=1 Tax=Aurantibacter sp. TaxID=2807103 RepID=UPI0035C8021B